MNCHTLEDGIELLQFHAIRRVFLVLGSDIPGGAGHTGLLVFCTLQDDLYSVSFLCHDPIVLI